MGKTIYFDCFSGISGDMVLGALIDLGVDFKKVKAELEKLKLKGYEIKAEKTNKMGIIGTDVEIKCSEDDNLEERNLAEITNIISESDLNLEIKKIAINIFTEIAIAEAKVHGKNIDEIHFHEVGAVDSIVDIVGAAICIEDLGIDKFYCSTISEGKGFVKCRHGLLPVPVPAVLEMLKGAAINLRMTDFEGELITPTGIGILKGTGAITNNLDGARILASGYGFGKKDTGGLNALRVLLLDENSALKKKPIEKSSKNTDNPEVNEEEIFEIETNIDDMTGEMLGYVMEMLIAEKALDVFFTPIQMKKNRPGIKLTVLCKRNDVEKFARIIIKETTSLGVRYSKKDRIICERTIEEIYLGEDIIRIKKASFDGEEKYSFEYEDLAEQAKKLEKPIFEIEKLITKTIKA
jgi:uncharacterized protein (TIGR00299 family) protein